RCERLRIAQTHRKSASEYGLGNLGVRRSQAIARIYRAQRMLLHHRSIPLAEYRLSTRAAGTSADPRSSLATGQTVTGGGKNGNRCRASAVCSALRAHLNMGRI